MSLSTVGKEGNVSDPDVATVSSFPDVFDGFVNKVTEALSFSSKLVATDYTALSGMNKSAIVFYKNLRTRLDAITGLSSTVESRSQNVTVSKTELDEIWERALKLEAFVNSFNDYTSELELRLSGTQKPSVASTTKN